MFPLQINVYEAFLILSSTIIIPEFYFSKLYYKRKIIREKLNSGTIIVNIISYNIHYKYKKYSSCFI